MSSSRLRDIFDAIQDTPLDQRDVALDALCAGDLTLKEQVLRLLASSKKLGEFLERPIVSLTPLLRDTVAAERVGEILGDYELIEIIGEGSFSTVWRARQLRPVRRDVAIKILKPGLDVATIAERFDQERDALARLEHPNISRIYDAGVHASGRPYFVMELVRGVPITEFARANALSPRQIVALLLDALNAVQFAHGQGLLHRDLKPQNILAGTIEGRTVVKVIDFGIAKIITPDRAAPQTLSAIPMGSPAYMSPEQFFMSSKVDERTDVYALGRVMHELLVGASTIPDRDVDAIMKSLGEKSVPPDLRRIVLAAVDENREQRLQSVGGFAEQLRRFLDGQAITVPTRAKHRRRIRSIAFAGSVLFVLLAGVVWLATRPTSKSPSAELIRTPRDTPFPAVIAIPAQWTTQVFPSSGFTWVDVDPVRRRVYATGLKGVVHELNLDTGSELADIGEKDRPILTACLSADGKRLAAVSANPAGTDWRIDVIETISRASVSRITTRGRVLALRFVDRGGTRIAASMDCDSPGIDFLDVSASKLIASSHPLLVGLKQYVLEATGDDRTVLTFDHGVRAVRLDSSTGNVVQTYNDLSGGQLLINVSFSQSLVMITGREEVIRTFDLDTGEPRGIYWSNQTTAGAASADAQNLIVSGTDGDQLIAHELASGKMRWRGQIPVSGPFAFRPIPGERRAIVWSSPATIQLINLPESQP